MAEKLPLIYIDGALSQLPPGVQIEGGALGNLIPGSGLVGGGDLQTGNKRLDVALASNPSGVIFVGDTIGMDGADIVAADAALSSGNAALVDAVPALASGVAGLADANIALASGNAALTEAANFVGSSSVILTASSVIQAGNPVGLDDAGKVRAITQVTNADSRTYGPQVVFENAESGDFSAAYDSTNNKVVVSYYDDANSRYGTTVVGTVSGSSISFGTPVVFHSSAVYTTGSTYDSSNNRIVITFTDSSNSERGSVVVGTVSGTSISFGTAVVYNSSGSTYSSSITYDSTNNKVVVAYIDGSNSSRGTAVVGTVSGTSISFGSAVVFEVDGISYPNITYDSSNEKVVIAYRDSGNSSRGTAVVGTVSGTSISFGTAVVFNSSGSTGYAYPCFDSSNGKVVIAYSDDSNTGSAIVGTVSGTSISFGTEVEFDSNSVSYVETAFDSTNNKVIVSYRANSGYLTALVGTVSGTSIAFGSPVVVNAASTYFPSSVYDPTNDRVVISYRDDGNSRYGTSQVGSPGASTFPTLGGVNNFIGTASSTVASGNSVQVNAPKSINYSNAGLSTGYFYYVDPTVSGFTTAPGQPSSWTPGDYSWGPVAKAVSSSGLLILDTI